MSRRVTLADVARATGVSSSTASLVLSGRGSELRISEAVQQRVRAAASDLGYRPNIVSVGLRKGATRTLGFLSDTVATSQLAGDMIKGAIDAAREQGYLLFIGETEGDDGAERRLLDAMADRRVDGLVLASMFTRRRALPPDLDRIPTVLLNTLPADPSTLPAVIPDEAAAGRAAAELLLAAGHRDLHLIGAGPAEDDVPPGTVAAVERLAGITAALADAGLRPASGRLLTSWQPPDGWEATRSVLAAHPRPGALICFNDRLAFGAYQALQEAGLRVPQDVSVVSFDDNPIAGWLRPGLTSFAIPHEELGRTAVEMLLATVTRAAGPGGPDADGPAVAGSPVRRLAMPVRARGSVGPAAPVG